MRRPSVLPFLIIGGLAVVLVAVVLVVSSSGQSDAPLLTVDKFGQGSVSGSGFDCGDDCSVQERRLSRGAAAVLQASPKASSHLVSWSGCDSVSGSQCRVVIGEDRTVLATFAQDALQVSPLARVLDERDLAQLVGTDSTSLLFGPAATGARGLRPGEILVADSADGFVRKVTSVTETAAGIRVQTTDASLADLVQKGTVILRTSSERRFAIARAPDGSARSGSSLTAVELSFDQEIPFTDGDFKGKFVTEMTVTADLEVQIDYDFFDLLNGPREVRVVLKTDLEAEVGVILDILDGKKEIDLCDNAFLTSFCKNFLPPTRFMVGPVPVWLNPDLELLLGAEGDVSALKATATFTNENSMGLHYLRGPGFSPIFQNKTGMEFVAPHIDPLNAEYIGYLDPRVWVKMWSLPVGPFLGLRFDAELLVQRKANPWWTACGYFRPKIGFQTRFFSDQRRKNAIGLEQEWSAKLGDVKLACLDSGGGLGPGEAGPEVVGPGTAGGGTGIGGTGKTGSGTTGNASPLATTFVLDVSGSMSNPWRGGIKLESAKLAAREVLDQIRSDVEAGSENEVALVTFSDDSNVIRAPTSDLDNVDLAIDGLDTESATNIGAGFATGLDTLRQSQPGSKKSLLLLTDGMSNLGLDDEAILSGPAREAASLGVCVYVLGVGNAGEIDEAFLQHLGATSNCGGYYPVTNALGIRADFHRAFLAISGTEQANFTGTVREGETLEAGSFEVPAGQRELVAALIWPGSSLQLNLVDPTGRAVDERYKGARFDVTSNRVSLSLANPRRGTWRLGLTGVDVPEGTTEYRALTSVRPAFASPSEGQTALVVVILTAALGFFAVGFVFLRPDGSSWILVLADGRSVPLRKGRNLVGRGPEARVRFNDPTVSKRHAEIRLDGNQPRVSDLQSPNGTFRNGRRIATASLSDGDQLGFGRATVGVRSKDRSGAAGPQDKRVPRARRSGRAPDEA